MEVKCAKIGRRPLREITVYDGKWEEVPLPWIPAAPFALDCSPLSPFALVSPARFGPFGSVFNMGSPSSMQ